jgi:serine/threonine protein kinase
MSEITCLKNSETKKYIIPTDKWLKPLGPLITSISTRGKIILGEMSNKNKVVVKITKNLDLLRIKYINYLVQQLPNFPKVYCVLECDENESNFDANYLKVNGFCNKSSDKFKIILEIMKLYPNKLSEYKNKLSIEQIKPILKQLFYALIYAFELRGFIHGDLHIENILINKQKKELTYIIKNNKYKLNIDEECIIMDFDKSITYDKQYMNLIDFNETLTLIYSIQKIIYICSSLYKKEKAYNLDPINMSWNKAIKRIHYNTIDQGISILTSYYQDSRDYEEFKSVSISDVIYILNIFWKDLYDEYLFPRHTINK